MCVLSGTELEIQEFLNEGGNIQLVISKLQPAMNRGHKDLAYQDLTGDSIPDLMFIDFSMQERMHILYCSNGQYEVFTSEKDPLWFRLNGMEANYPRYKSQQPARSCFYPSYRGRMLQDFHLRMERDNI